MHKALNQDIQLLKEDLDKREQDILKYKSLLNNVNMNVTANGNNSLGTNGLQIISNPLVNTIQNLGNASPMSSAVNLSSYSLTSSMSQSDDTLDMDSQDRLESWLSIPNKRNIKKHGWKKLYVVLKKGKLFFYNSLRDMKESQEPYMTIDLELVVFFLLEIMNPFFLQTNLY